MAPFADVLLSSYGSRGAPKPVGAAAHIDEIFQAAHPPRRRLAAAVGVIGVGGGAAAAMSFLDIHARHAGVSTSSSFQAAIAGDLASTSGKAAHATMEVTADAAKDGAKEVNREEAEVEKEIVEEVHKEENDIEDNGMTEVQEDAQGLDQMRCFPGDARVYVQGRGASVPLRELCLGDRILCGIAGEIADDTKLCFSKFLGFLHAEEHVKTRFLAVKLRNRSTLLRLTLDHLVFVRDILGVDARRAASLRPGDCVLTLSVEGAVASSEVEFVRDKHELNDNGNDIVYAEEKSADKDKELAEGAYAPLTEVGTVIVDGVLCSNYADVIGWGKGFHDAAHRALGPWRVLASIVINDMSMLKLPCADDIDKGVRIGHHQQGVAGSPPDRKYTNRVNCAQCLPLLGMPKAEHSGGVHPVAAAMFSASKLLPIAAWRWLDSTVASSASVLPA